MRKSSFLLLAITLTFAGCAPISFQQFGEPLPQPRPIADHFSEASQILYGKMPQFRARQHPKLAVDTSLWEDEADEKTKVGFDYDYNYRVLYKGYVDDAPTKILVKYGSLPAPIREQGASNVINPAASGSGPSVVDAGVDALAFSGSVGHASVTQPGSHGFSKLGIGVGAIELLGLMFASQNDVSDQLYGLRGLAITLTDEERKRFETADRSKSWGHLEYIGQLLVQSAAEILADKGFKPAGRYWYRKDDEWYIFQTVSNPSLGCPEPDPDAKPGTVRPNDFCRIEFYIGPTRMFIEQIDKKLVAGVMGGNNPHILDNGFGVPLTVFAANKPEDHREEINEYLFDQLPRRFPRITVFIPARRLGRGNYEPPYILDKNGRHYFSVTMPRKPDANTTALYDDSLSNK